MKQSAGKSALSASFFGKIKQKSKHLANKKAFLKRFLMLLVLVAVFGGFFCLIFLTSWDSLKKAKNSTFATPGKVGAFTEELFAKKALANPKLAEPSCNFALPLASLAEPSIALLKIEKLCSSFEFEQEAASGASAITQNNEINPQDIEKEALESQLSKILTGTPMEEMIEHISNQPRIVAAYLVGIALKESQFGKHSPQKNGATCYNYWGYKGKENPTISGYSCFSSAQEAVETVGKRLEKLAIEQKRDTPSKMTVWKCGSSCETHSPESVTKWISDVSRHYYQINPH